MILSKIFKSSPILKSIPRTTSIPLSMLRTTPKISAPLPAFLVVLAKPLAMASAALIGRGFRIGWGRISTEKKIKLKQKWTKMLAISGGVMSGCVVYGYASHVVVCPYTGRRKFVALSQEQVRGNGSI